MELLQLNQNSARNECFLIQGKSDYQGVSEVLTSISSDH